jgi:hypothetical protein
MYPLGPCRGTIELTDMVKVARKIKEVAGAVDNISKFKKLSKRHASYIEYDKFTSSNLREGYFCYNCIYWINIEGGKCMIVEDDGADVMGNVSDVIAAHGCCSGYDANFDKLSDTRTDSKRKPKLTTNDVT